MITKHKGVRTKRLTIEIAFIQNLHKCFILFNDALNTFYLRLNGIRHMVKDHSCSERENPLPPHGLLFPISSKGLFYMEAG